MEQQRLHVFNIERFALDDAGNSDNDIFERMSVTLSVVCKSRITIYETADSLSGE